MSAKHTPLAVISPQTGTLSETFVRRHMTELLPGRTAVVAGRADPPFGGHWSVPPPALILDPARRGHRLTRLLRGEPVPRFLRRHGVRAILAEYLDHALPYLPLAQKLGARFYAHAHGYDVSCRLREPVWRERYLALRAADGIVTVSEWSRQKLIGLGLPAERIRVIPCATDVPATPPAARPEGPLRCVAIGRLVPKKGSILLLDSFRRAREAVPELHLDLIGTGPLLPAARQYVQALGLREAVTIHGGKLPAEIAPFLAGAGLFLHHAITDEESGDEEGLPVSLLEAMAHGAVPVSTRHAGIPEAVIDGEHGLLGPEGDSAGMAERIVTLARDAGLRARFRQAAWERARERFTWERERCELLSLMGFADE